MCSSWDVHILIFPHFRDFILNTLWSSSTTTPQASPIFLKLLTFHRFGGILKQLNQTSLSLSNLTPLFHWMIESHYSDNQPPKLFSDCFIYSLDLKVINAFRPPPSLSCMSFNPLLRHSDLKSSKLQWGLNLITTLSSNQPMAYSSALILIWLPLSDLSLFRTFV